MKCSPPLPRAPDVGSIASHVEIISSLGDVKGAVEANHDRNGWWPPDVFDWRLRILVAGWSTRISSEMVSTYSAVVARASEMGYDAVVEMSSEDLERLIAPLGLPNARRRYLYSMDKYLRKLDAARCDPREMSAEIFIAKFVENVDQAGFKVAQCAALYSRGYHCGVIPVDSGMVSKLAPRLGLRLSSGSIAHEEMRLHLEEDARQNARRYLALIRELGYRITIPDGVSPTWWLHLVLIYFKRLYCNRPSPRLCRAVPMCSRIVDCRCVAGPL